MCPPDNPLAGRGERHPVTPPEKCLHRCVRETESVRVCPRGSGGPS